MTLLSVLALAVALSLDSLGVGVAYGLRRIRVPGSLYLIVAACSGALMGLSMLAGGSLSGCLTPVLARRAGGLILVAVGLWQVLQGWQGYRQSLAGPGDAGLPGPRQLAKLDLRALGLVVQILVEPATADLDRSGVIETPEALALGLALGLDSLGAGFGAAMAGYDLAAVPIVALTCAAFVRLGLAAAGRAAVDGALRKAFFVPGVLLIVLGALRF